MCRKAAARTCAIAPRHGSIRNHERRVPFVRPLATLVALLAVTGCAGLAEESGSENGGVAKTSIAIGVPSSAPEMETGQAMPGSAPSSSEPVSSTQVASAQPPSEAFSKLIATGIPALAARAYLNASQRAPEALPKCTMPPEVLAAVGAAESRHGAVGSFDEDGTSREPIKGYAPTGEDTDGGALDGDTEKDFAVGPMQFTPETWADLGRDGDGDGDFDPHNFYDAALATAAYLCHLTGPFPAARFIVGQWDPWERQNRQREQRTEILHANWETRKREREELEKYVSENPEDTTNGAVLARLKPLEPEPVYEELPLPSGPTQLRNAVERYYGPESKVRDDYRDNVESVFRRLVSGTGGVEVTLADRLA